MKYPLIGATSLKTLNIFKKANIQPCLLCFTAMPTGVCGGKWGVSLENVCGVRGTSVVIKCQYDYPFPHFVTSVTWSKYDPEKRSLIPLKSLAAPPDYQYVGNYRGDCSLKINRIRQDDSGNYLFSFVTSLDSWKSKKFALVTVKGDKITHIHIYLQYFHPYIYMRSYTPVAPLLRLSPLFFS